MPDITTPTDAPAASDTTEVSTNTSGPVITTERKSTEVLDGNGKSLSESRSALGDIFNKIAEGKSAEEAVTEVVKTEDKGNKRPLFDKVEEPIVLEKKVEDKTPAAPEQKTEEATQDDVTEEELRILPHDKPKTAKRIEKLLKKLNDAETERVTTRKEADDRAKRVAELEEEIGKVKSVDPLANEQVKQRLDELAMYKRRYALENDPEVKKRFDDRVVGAETGIQKILTDNAAPESLVQMVKNAGGWIKFADSRSPVELANGKTMTAAELAEAIRSQLPLSERRRLEAMELEQTQAGRDKEVYFSEEQKKASEWFKQQEDEAKNRTVAQQKAFEEATKYVGTWKEKLSTTNDWLKLKEAPASASAEDKAAIADHNNHVKQLQSQMDKYLAAKDLDGMLEVVTDAVKYHQERRNIAGVLAEKARLEAQLKASRDEFDRYKKASSAVPRSGSLSSPPLQSQGDAPKAPPSLEDAFDRIAAGKSLDS